MAKEKTYKVTYQDLVKLIYDIEYQCSEDYGYDVYFVTREKLENFIDNLEKK